MLIALVFVLRLPSVQTWLAQKAATWLSEKIGSRVEVKGVNIQFFDTVILEGVYIEDQQKDTLLYTTKLYASIEGYDSEKGLLTLSEIKLLDNNVELKKYPNDKGLNFEFIANAFKSKEKSSGGGKFELNCRKLTLVNNKFSYTILGVEPMDAPFNPNDIDIDKLNAEFDDFGLVGDSIYAHINNLSATDKCGLSIKEMDANFAVSSKGLLFENLVLKTPNSYIKGKVDMFYDNYGAFANFFDSIRFDCSLEESKVNFSDLAYFVNTLEGANMIIGISGDFSGIISKLKSKKLAITYGNNTKVNANVTISGLPNANEAFIDAKTITLKTTPSDIATIPIPPYINGAKVELPKEMYSLTDINFTGKYRGFFTDFVAEGTFITNLGVVNTDLQLTKIDGQDKYAYSGKVNTQGFELGQIVKGQGLGKITANLNVQGSGFSTKDIAAVVKGNVVGLDYNGYNYNNIVIDGKLNKTVFSGNVNSTDPNIAFNFDGSFDFDKKKPTYNFNTQLVSINLTKLGFIKLDSTLILSAKLNSNLTGNTLETIDGDLQAENLSVKYGTTTYPVGQLNLISSTKTKPKQLRIDSDIADVNVIGDYHLETVANSVIKTLNTFLPSFLLLKESKLKEIPNQDFQYTITLKNVKPILAIWAPKIVIPSGGDIQGNYMSSSNNLRLYANFNQVDIAKTPFKDWAIEAITTPSGLKVTSSIQRLEAADSLYFDNISVNSTLFNDSIKTNVLFENTVDSIVNKGNIDLLAKVFDLDKIAIRIPRADIQAYNYTWIVRPDNEIVFNDSILNINKLIFETENESFRVFGRISENPDDQINILLNKFNLLNVNRFLPKNSVSLKGLVSGSISLSNILDDPLFRSTLKIETFKLNDASLGNGTLISQWNKENNSINIKCQLNHNDTVKSVSIIGDYFTKKKRDNLDFDINLNRIYLAILNPYLKGNVQFSQLSDLSAQLKLTGDDKKPKLEGTASVKRGKATVEYLGTTYNFRKDFRILENKIVIDSLVLVDNNGGDNNALVNGEVLHNNFGNWRYNINIKANKFNCLNTTSKDNSLYYGKAYATGLIKISGKPDRTFIDINVKTEPGTQFFLPLSSPSSASASDFIVFVNNKLTANKKPVKPSSSTSIVLNMNLDVTPDAEAFVIFDEKVGDVIKGKGSGNLKMDIDTKGEFKMYGLYTIDKGEYMFTLENVVNKSFEVEKGGTIQWAGDPYNATVDLTAIYNLKAVPAPVIGDSSEVFRRKYPVECKLIMKENLLQPSIDFAINLPTLDENSRARINSNLQSTEELNKQIFALLILNQFLPISVGGVVASAQNNANLGAGLGNSGFEVLSSQLSRWISQISDDFDVSVNYRPGQSGISQQIDIGLSTTLFNDRLVLDGSVGYGGVNMATNNNANAIISDFSIEYKISQDGRFRLKAFNRSNQNNLIQNSLFTQGLGLYYRVDFDRFKEVLIKKGYSNIPGKN